jgi:2-succinyl-5-enolpyruvyl-6-hydroxy-3-cyclohexene-1-carboxylate synthase
MVVINNGGGRIFDYLPQHDLPGLEALWRTPVSLDLAAVATLFGLRHWRAANAESFAAALDEALGAPGPGMIELRIDAEVSHRLHLEFWRRVRQHGVFSS